MTGKRELILELGEKLILTKGYNGFSYQDISSELGIKNAAVHYYFANKEHLGVSIIKTNFQRFEEMTSNMQEFDFNPIKKIETFLKIYTKSQRENRLCIIGSLSADIETLSPTMQTELTKMIRLVLDWLQGVLVQGKEQNLFEFKETESVQAFTILSTLVASLQISRVQKQVEYKSFTNSILEGLKK